MQPLDYETPHPAARPRSAALFVLPGIATCLALYLVYYDGTEEPFMVFSTEDATTHVAAPFVALGLWLYWGVRARRQKLSVFAVVPVVVFAVLKLWFIFMLGLSYFSEGWNT